MVLCDCLYFHKDFRASVYNFLKHILFVGMLTYKHSEVCILKTHMHMLTYEVDLLLLKLIKYFSQSIFHMFSI
jgi:hypothetical protein